MRTTREMIARLGELKAEHTRVFHTIGRAQGSNRYAVVAAYKGYEERLQAQIDMLEWVLIDETIDDEDYEDGARA